MKRPMAVLALIFLLAAAPSFSGTYFSSVTTSEGQKGAAGMNVTVRGWAEGDKARVEFAESDNPILKPGLFLITLDGGATVYLVDPKERTFSKFDMGAMSGTTGEPAAGAHGAMTMTFSDPKVEKLGESDGGAIAGVATKHLRYRTTYGTAIKVMGLLQTTLTQIEEDLWVAPKVADAALGIWLGKGPKQTGDAEFDTLLAAQQQKYDGFPLKRAAVITTTDKSGKKTVVKIATTVTELIVGEMPAGTFAMGAGYREKPLTPMPGQPGDEQQANADETKQEDERYPFDRMIDQPDNGQQSAQPGNPTAQPQPGQPAMQPGQPATKPGAQPSTPSQPQPEPEPEPQDQPEYPFELMLDTPQR